MENLARFFARRAWAVLLSPLGLLLVSATRLLVVADDKPVTAVAIASSGGYINTLLGTLIPLVPVLLPYIALFFLIFRRFILSGLAFLAAAFVSPAKQGKSGRLASVLHANITDWSQWLPPPFSSHSPMQWVHSGGWQPFLLLIILISIFISWYSRSRAGYRWLSLLWIFAAAAIVVPVMSPIYHLPMTGNFYVSNMRRPWLSEEKLRLVSGKYDYGYMLAISANWITELTAGSRTIRYIPASEVVSRAVCQQQEKSSPRGRKLSPLIPLPKTTHVRRSSCPMKDGPEPPTAGSKINRAAPASFLSRGQSLLVIESAVHRSPGAIISETNAHEHQRLSSSLRAYEIAGKWWKPTPVGQRFWYYPRDGH